MENLWPALRQVDHLLLVDPALDFRVGHADADVVPLVVFERHELGGLFSEASYQSMQEMPDHGAGPAADDEAARLVADGKSRGREEVAAHRPLALELHS